jgi:predicted membrane protein (TIGR00267 family)
MAGVLDGKLIIGAGIGASLAMGISGASGAYLTEKAERKRKLKELESAMLRDLDDTSHGRAARFSYIFASLVDGLSPALGAMLVVSPFFFLPAETAVSTSLTIAFLLLFSLGAYLGKICEEKIWWYGIQMLLIGFLTVLIIYSAGMMI